MKKLKKQNKFAKLFFDNRFLFLSAGCSAAIMFVIYMCYGLFPIGETTLLRMDLYHQYGPLFAELCDRVSNAGSFYYSFTTGLGSSFLGNYFNYLSSPIGFIVAMIAGHENIPEGIAVMVLIKASLSAFTLSYYLKKSQKKSNYVSAGFGVLYAFCGWFIAYYWNVMWVDAVFLLPLIALGIERIIDNGKPVLYIAALAATMFSNYYMSFMMCIFSVLYFLTYFLSKYSLKSKLAYTKEKKNGKLKKYNRFIKSAWIFALSSLCAAGLMAFALVPTYITLQQSSATSGTFPSTPSFYFSVFDFICNHIASVTPTIRSSGEDVLPNVYCGILTVIMIPLYLMVRSISKREKAMYIGLLCFFLISFDLNILNYIWHGFHFPNDLPYRQSFMYSFILIVIAFKTFSRLKEIPARYILFSSCAVVALTVMGQKLESKNMNGTAMFVSIVFAAVYALVLVTLKDKKFQTVSVSVLLLCCICSEAIIGDTQKFNIDQKKSNYAGDYSSFREVKDYIDEINEDPFYRMELTRLRTRMDPSWYNYNGVSVFSSMAYEKVSNLQKSLGLYGNKINSYTYNPQTAVYNSMFSLKYLVNNISEYDVLANSELMTQIYSNDTFTAYKNEKYLPIGYCVDTAVSNWGTASSDPFDVQNDLFEKTTGVSDVLVRTFPTNISYTNIKTFGVPITNQIFSYNRIDNSQNGTVNFDFEAENNSEVYVYATTTDTDNETLTIKTENQTITETMNKSYPFILNIGQLKKGEKFSCSVPLNSDSGTIYLYVCYLDNDAFEKGYEKLKSGSLVYDTFSDTEIKGTFFADETSVFMTTIPYDEGWSVYVDGNKISGDDLLTVGDALLGFYVTEGYHELELKFTPKGISEGKLISLITVSVCILLLIIYLILKKRGKKINRFDPVDNSFDTDVFISLPNLKKVKEKSDIDLPQLEIIRPFDLTDEDIDVLLTDENISENDVNNGTNDGIDDDERFAEFFSPENENDK